MSQFEIISTRTDGKPLPKYSVKPYRPDGGYHPGGLGMLLSIMVLGSAAVGYAANLVSHSIFLIIVFPLLMGWILGFIGRQAIRSGLFRNPNSAGAIGIVSGILALGMMHYFGYEDFKAELAKWSGASRQIAEQWLRDPNSVDMSGWSSTYRAQFMKRARVLDVQSFPQYIDRHAQMGVSIKQGRSSKDKPVNLGYAGTYIYWLVEIGIISWVCMTMLRSEASKPFCVACSRWKTRSVMGHFGCRDSGEAVVAIESGDANAWMHAKPIDLPSKLRICAYTCPDCQGEGAADLRLEHLKRTRKGHVSVKTIAQTRYPAEAMPLLNSFFAPQAAFEVAKTGHTDSGDQLQADSVVTKRHVSFKVTLGVRS